MGGICTVLKKNNSRCTPLAAAAPNMQQDQVQEGTMAESWLKDILSSSVKARNLLEHAQSCTLIRNQPLVKLAAEARAARVFTKMIGGVCPCMSWPAAVDIDMLRGACTISTYAGESLDSGSLKQRLAGLSMEELEPKARQLLATLLYVQVVYDSVPDALGGRLINRDMKLSNTCLEVLPSGRWHFTAIDHGGICSASGSDWFGMLDVWYVDPYMAAPYGPDGQPAVESFEGLRAHTHPAIDRFSAGMAVVEFLYGRRPRALDRARYSDEELHQYVQALADFDPATCEEIAVLPEELRDLLCRLMAADPRDRPQTAAEALQHPYITGVNSGRRSAVDLVCEAATEAQAGRVAAHEELGSYRGCNDQVLQRVLAIATAPEAAAEPLPEAAAVPLPEAAAADSGCDSDSGKRRSSSEPCLYIQAWSGSSNVGCNSSEARSSSLGQEWLPSGDTSSHAAGIGLPGTPPAAGSTSSVACTAGLDAAEPAAFAAAAVGQCLRLMPLVNMASAARSAVPQAQWVQAVQLACSRVAGCGALLCMQATPYPFSGVPAQPFTAGAAAQAGPAAASADWFPLDVPLELQHQQQQQQEQETAAATAAAAAMQLMPLMLLGVTDGFSSISQEQWVLATELASSLVVGCGALLGMQAVPCPHTAEAAPPFAADAAVQGGLPAAVFWAAAAAVTQLLHLMRLGSSDTFSVMRQERWVQSAELACIRALGCGVLPGWQAVLRPVLDEAALPSAAGAAAQAGPAAAPADGSPPDVQLEQQQHQQQGEGTGRALPPCLASSSSSSSRGRKAGTKGLRRLLGGLQRSGGRVLGGLRGRGRQAGPPPAS
ncbi:hypothetical protein COO60DRAFT_75082 [Scenedesmus sp. NREL 46B-D3]|nr:hypothetical protein COO60DRAFT_75082 [Scenedesmus sp. NREL 46B-D3]